MFLYGMHPNPTDTLENAMSKTINVSQCDGKVRNCSVFFTMRCFVFVFDQ